MRTPPFMMAAALLFWGWQNNHLVWAAPMAAALESARLARRRWEFSDGDLARIWYLCLAILGGISLILYSTQDRMVFVFKFAQMLPVSFLPIMLAQAYGDREDIPWTVFAGMMKAPPQPGPRKAINITYVYYALTVVAASASTQANGFFYLGMAALILPALGAVRPRRMRAGAWVILAVVAVVGGSFGHRELRRLQMAMEQMLGGFIADLIHQSTDSRECRTSIGKAGRMTLSDKIDLRVTPDTPGFPPRLLTEAVYDTYRSEIWSCSSNNEMMSVTTRTNDTVALLPSKNVVWYVQIASYFEEKNGSLVVPHGVYELDDILALFVYTNRIGTVGIDDAPGLVDVKARWGPGATLGGRPGLADLGVPENERPALAKIVASLHLEGMTTRQKVKSVERYFADGFSYSLDIPFQSLGRSETYLSHFLTKTKSGHCQYYATATTLLLREAGVPARYTVGFAVPDSGRRGSTYLIREKDRHAWVQAYREDIGAWEEVDTTPGGWEATVTSADSWWSRLSDFGSDLYFRYSEWRWSKTSLARYASWMVIPLILYLVVRIVLEQRGKSLADSNSAAAAIEWPGLDSELYQIDQQLEARNLSRRPAETLAFWQQRLEKALPEASRLRRIFRLHRALRFDPEGLTGAERQTLREEAREWMTDFASRNPEMAAARGRRK